VSASNRRTVIVVVAALGVALVMVLAASTDAGAPILIEPGPAAAPGMRVR